MHTAYSPWLRSSRSKQRRQVVALAMVLCLWLFAFAAHIHGKDDHRSSIHPSGVCTFCLSFSGGTAPPAEHRVPSRVLASSVVIADSVATLIAIDVPSSYLSQGPPAH
jgi:hypothetical protein